MRWCAGDLFARIRKGGVQAARANEMVGRGL